MPITFTNPSNICLTVYFEAGALRVDCEGSQLPVADQHVICEVDANATVDFTLELDDPNAVSLSASHYDSAGQLQQWSGTNPREFEFGLTGGDVDVDISASSSSQQGTTIVRVKVKPMLEKPF